MKMKMLTIGKNSCIYCINININIKIKIKKGVQLYLRM